MIGFKNISKTFHDGDKEVKALQGVSLTIETGDIFGIIGYSGAGKSTLVRCINGLETPDEGRVLINGEDISSYSEKQLQKRRRKIGMISQHFNLLNSANVYQNVAAPLKNHTGLSKAEVDRRVNELLELTGLSDKKDAYPSHFSGGQKQRVAIARALGNEPDILLCDEATSALDQNTTRQILNLIKQIKDKLNLTVVLITHQMEVVKSICNRVAIMEHGKISETGNLVDVFSNPQSPIAINFISKTTYYEQAKETAVLWKRNLYKLTFVGNNANDPIINRLAKKYPITISMLFGNIEKLNGHSFGILIVDIEGKDEDISAAIEDLKGQNILVEVISYE